MNQLSRLLNLRLLVIGHTVLTPAGLCSAGLVMAATFFAAWVAGLFFTRLRNRTHAGRAPLYVVQKLVSYGLVAFGIMTGFSTLGINLSSLAVFAGAIGVGVGLGLQGVVREFVSGLVLIFDNALHVGDFIELDGGKTRGEVIEIGARATHVRTNDNVDVLVPNSKLIDGEIINWTLGDTTRRIHVPFTVAYGADKAKVRDVVLEAAHGVSFTRPDEEQRKTQVWLTGLGDSALNFELVVWPTVDAVKRPASMQAAYTWAIEDALRCANIEMPFPQMDIRLRSLFGKEDEAAQRALGLAQAGEGTAPRPRDATGANDAAEDTLRPDAKPAPPPEPEPPRRGRWSRPS